jgi:hypothetical protein
MQPSQWKTRQLNWNEESEVSKKNICIDAKCQEKDKLAFSLLALI